MTYWIIWTIYALFELCKTNEQNANTRDEHLFYGTRILPDFIENNRWIQINRAETGQKPDTSQMKKRPICIGVFESAGNQIDWVSQFSQFQQYLNILMKRMCLKRNRFFPPFGTKLKM